MAESKMELLLNACDMYACILDKNSNIILMNDKHIAIIGQKDKKNVLGYGYECYRGVQDCALESFYAQDKCLIEQKKTLRFLSYRLYADKKWHLLIGSKSCFFDKNGEAVEIFSESKDITNYKLVDISRFVYASCYVGTKKSNFNGFELIIKDDQDDVGLTQKECIILFFLLRGKSFREISELISRSEKTVTFHIENMKVKFNVSSKSSLIEKAICLGYMNMLPQALIV